MRDCDSLTSFKVATIYRRPRSHKWKRQWKYLKFQSTIWTGRKVRRVLWSWEDWCHQLHRKIANKKGNLYKGWNWRPTYRLSDFWGKVIFTDLRESRFLLLVIAFYELMSYPKSTLRNYMKYSCRFRKPHKFKMSLYLMISCFMSFIIHQILIVDIRRRSRQLKLWKKISLKAFRAWWNQHRR